jgi:hypothetical protein
LGNSEFESILPLDSHDVSRTPEEERALERKDIRNPHTTNKSHAGAAKSPRGEWEGWWWFGEDMMCSRVETHRPRHF